jgi:hypothetical protein
MRDLEPLEVRGELRVDSGDVGGGTVPALRGDHPGALVRGVRLERLLDEREARLDVRFHDRRQLVLLDQRLFADADLPEVVQEARVAELLHLLL